MARVNVASQESPFFSLPHARWVVSVLNMLIAVVGRDSLLGLLLRQTRSEIESIIRDEAPDIATARAAQYQNN
jgi:uncharacterized membrane protein